MLRVATSLAIALAAFLFVTATFVPATSAQPATTIVDTLPSNTCAWIHTHDFAGWNKAYASSQFRRLLDRPAFQAFSSAWNQHTDSDAFALEFGLTMSELTQLARQDFVVAWLPAGPNELTTLAIVDTTGAEEHVTTFMAKSAERFIKNGYQEQEITMGDGQFRQFVSGDKQTVIGHHNNHFLVTHKLNVVRDYLQPATAGQLSSDAGHRYVLERLGNSSDDQTDSRIHWYCSPWRVMEHSPSPPSNLRLMVAQGFDAVDAVGGTFAFDAENVMTYNTVAHIKQPLQGSAVSLRTQPVTTQLPDWLVAGSRGVQVAGLDAQSVLAGYAKWFDATEGEGEEGIFDLVLEEIRDEPDAPGVDIKVELFDQVASPLYSVRPKSPAGSNSEVLPVVIVVKAKQAAVVQSAIGRMLEGDPDVRRVSLGAIAPDVVAWQFGDLTNGGTRQVLGPDLSQVTVCVYRDHVLASSRADSIAALITPSNNANVANDSNATLSKLDALVKDVATRHPERSLIGYRFALGADWLAQGYQRIRNAEVIEQSESTTVTLGNVTVTMLNRLISGPAQSAFSKLPTRSEAQKHLGVALDVVHTANQDGWLASGVIQPASSPADATGK